MLVFTAILLGMAGCNGGDTRSDVKAPGLDKSSKTEVLDASAAGC
jgi:hypothetical protein